MKNGGKCKGEFERNDFKKGYFRDNKGSTFKNLEYPDEE